MTTMATARTPHTGSNSVGPGKPGLRHMYRFVLQASPSTSQVCRAMAQVTAQSWGADRDDAGLIADELSANAIRATLDAHKEAPSAIGPPLIVIRFICTATMMRIELWDRAPGQPEAQTPDYESEHGRGLFLVDNLTGGVWGCHLRPGHRDEHGTKCVWAEIPRTICTSAAQHGGRMPGPASS